jgi:hypothetical protein
MHHGGTSDNCSRFLVFVPMNMLQTIAVFVYMGVTQTLGRALSLA